MTTPLSFNPCATRWSAIAWVTARTLLNVKSAAITPRQPEVPNFIFSIAI
jgi:hypothetical protein